MATGEIVREQPVPRPAGTPAPPATTAGARPGPLDGAVKALASLRLTVTLFAMLIFLVFAGTLAQKDQGVWQVVEHTYFRVWFAWIDFQAFARLIELWTKRPLDGVPGGFWFPGGTLIGVALGANLLAAHSIRFRVAAKGQRLAAGVAVTAVGLAMAAALVIADQRGAVEGALSSGVQAALWHTLRASVAGLALLAAYLFGVSKKPARSPERIIAAAAALILGVLGAWLFANPTVRLNPSGLRILWLLAVCLAVSAVCYSGCVMLFKKRAGIVLLHAGVLLLMVGELVVGLAADEGRMSIQEGQTVNYAYDIRTTELAVVDASDPDEDVVTVVPQRLLASESVVANAELPFKIRQVEFQANSFLAPPAARSDNPATRGAGAAYAAVPVKQAAGVDGGRIDLPSVYAELIDPKTDESLGVYLFSAAVDREGLGLQPQAVEVGGKAYQVELRFKRQYKPYSVELVDFRFDRYVGSDTPKNYSSDVIIHDPSRSIDRPSHISMNDPTRHAGDTLYQSGFDERTERGTVLQVVTNTGRLIPYLSCVMVGLGLFSHFGQTLLRFFDRREREVGKPPRGAASRDSAQGWSSPAKWAPAAAVLLLGCYVVAQARPATDDPNGMPVQRFASLTLVDGGRVKPFDSYAREVLQQLSNRQEIRLSGLDPEEVPACAAGQDRVPATRWMLDVVSQSEGAGDYRVFRIDNLDLLSALGLELRTGSFRYSINEVLEQQDQLARQLELAAQVDEAQRSLFQVKVIELVNKVSRYRVMEGAFSSFGLLQAEEIPEEFAQQIAEAALRLQRSNPPLPVPPQSAEGRWHTLLDAEVEGFLARDAGRGVNPATPALADAIAAYEADDVRGFSEALDTLETSYAKYQKQLNSPLNAEAVSRLKPAERLSLSKASFEVWFNQFSPFTVAAELYVVAFVVSVLSWVVAPRALGRTAIAIVGLTLALHTFAIVGRLYISGRPPVTNLYSSAVFIGWAMVVFGLVIDAVYRMGFGTALGAAAGFLTMLIAYFLGQDGDTFMVMQAVLDTQFWLATHVVCITLGYSATFMAGFCALAYVACRNPALFCVVLAAASVALAPMVTGALFGPALAAPAALLTLAWVLADKRRDEAAAIETERLLTRVTYGVLCFALLFSFIGTVLGGLWADDSWGRFWGWDPKENGAMIIVLWNALILHARWGALITPRGLAALALFGNVVTTWSWFGTNELGVGLHAYGGVSDGMSLGMTIITTVLVTHLPLIPLAFCPRSAWQAWFGGRPVAA